MGNNLKEYFPLIRERNEVLADINSRQSFRNVFDGWKKEQQEEFLDFCTGVKGVKILNDSFFKEVMNPEYAPERLNDFLSTVLFEKSPMEFHKCKEDYLHYVEAKADTE